MTGSGKATLEEFRQMVRAALRLSVESDGVDVVLWSNAPGSRANETAARTFAASSSPRALLVSETEAGRAILDLATEVGASPEQLDVAWGLVSHRFIRAAKGTVRAFVAGATATRIFRAVEARELADLTDGGAIHFHDGDGLRTLDRHHVLSSLATNEGDFFVTRDPDEQLIVMEEAERLRPGKPR